MAGSSLATELVLGAIAFFTVTYITLAVWLRNPKSWTNRFFLFLGGILAIYVPINFLSLNPPENTPENQLFWIRMVMILASIKGPALLFLAHTFPGERFLLRTRYLIMIIFLMLIGITASFSPFVFSGIQYTDGQALPVPGPGMILFLLNFGGTVIASFVILRMKYLTASGTEKIRIYNFLIGILLTFILIITATLVSIFVFQTSFAVFLGPIFPVILSGFIAYAIVKHHFMDIQPAIARAVSYIILLFLVAAIYSASLFFATTYIFKGIFDIETAILGIILATGVALTFQPLYFRIRKWTDRVFFKGLYNFDELLAALTKVMIAKIDLGELTKNLLEILIKEMRVNKAAFLIIDNHKITDVRGVGWNDSALVGLELEHLLHLTNDGEVKSIVFEQIADESIKNLFRENDLIVAIPIRSGEKEVALLVLGPKLAGDLYNAKDLMLLEIFASQSGIVIENSKLYDNLKQALESKSQFISVVSHQMRTPISAIRWSLELLQQKNLAPQKRSEFLTNAYHNSLFLVEQLDDVLTSLSIQDNEAVANKAPADINSFPRDLAMFFDHAIKEKNLSVNFNLNGADSVVCDASKVKKVIKVLLQNAVTYTPAGGRINIASRNAKEGGKDFYVFSITDTGIGITEEEKVKIFERFFRGDRARLALPDGMGLGMFIAKIFIEAHGGEITVESAGRDKGSIFSFKLPIK